MKRIYILRHAHSPRGLVPQDIERTLDQQGREECAKLGLYLQTKEELPEQIICSVATRTQETVNNIQKIMGISLPVTLSNNLYTSSMKELYDEIYNLSDKVSSVLLVSHNPAVYYFSLSLADPSISDKEVINSLEKGFKEAAMVMFEVDIERWIDIAPHSGKANWFFSP